ncbi:MAG: TIM barrel protein [Flavobacteriaceae bacterium]|nr:TIM barrel protein [Flavobacteriaceae bacterium]MCY4267863.1 TIM barrel protein [Flavobacteriaceae bacterium]MCY4299362.1 TIM barrel protein [Flavobacteriaceae bacterium]
MNRRSFAKFIALSAPLTAFSNYSLSSSWKTKTFPSNNQFNLKYAPHLGMFKHSAGDNPIDQLHFMADVGFQAFEDNRMRQREMKLQNEMASTMEKRGLQMGVFVAHTISWKKADLTSGNQELREKFLKEITDSIEIAKRIHAKWMTVVPGHIDPRQNMDYQTSHVIETLKHASEILEPHGLVMVLEPLNFMNHPGLFLTRIPQAYQICKAVDSPSCKILFDIYHQQIQEGNLIHNIQTSWDEIGYFQIGDNPGRKEPTTGEINYKNVFQYIHSQNYQGILGMEHGNASEGIEGEQSVINAYKFVDNFLS